MAEQWQWSWDERGIGWYGADGEHRTYTGWTRRTFVRSLPLERVLEAFDAASIPDVVPDWLSGDEPEDVSGG